MLPKDERKSSIGLGVGMSSANRGPSDQSTNHGNSSIKITVLRQIHQDTEGNVDEESQKDVDVERVSTNCVTIITFS